MTDAERDVVTATLNELPFVRWDRFVDVPEVADIGEGSIDVYGWIDRPDAHEDFILLTFPRPIDGRVGYTTSSAARSSEIGQILHDNPIDIPCQRVDEHLPGVNSTTSA